MYVCTYSTSFLKKLKIKKKNEERKKGGGNKKIYYYSIGVTGSGRLGFLSFFKKNAWGFFFLSPPPLLNALTLFINMYM